MTGVQTCALPILENIFVNNGEIQLVLMPEDDLDRIFTSQLLKSGPLEVEAIRQPVSILGKSVQDGIIIRAKRKQNDTTETKDVQGVSKSKTNMESSQKG